MSPDRPTTSPEGPHWSVGVLVFLAFSAAAFVSNVWSLGPGLSGDDEGATLFTHASAALLLGGFTGAGACAPWPVPRPTRVALGAVTVVCAGFGLVVAARYG